MFLFPFEFFASPNAGQGAAWNEPGKNRALLLGLPAILFAVTGIAVLCWAEFGMSASLEDRYLMEAEKSSKEKKRIAADLTRELRILRSSKQDVADEDLKSNDELIPNDDPRRIELEKWLDQEEVYWQKLIDLNPQEAEYKYNLAIVSIEKGNLYRGLALMNLTAPLDEPGFIDGHLWLSKFHWNIVTKTKIPQEILSNAKLALRHLEQCLKRDQSNQEAKQVKALILYSMGDLKNAYPLYEELFQDDVRMIERLVEMNTRLNREDENRRIVDQAISRYQKLLQDPSLDDEQWQKGWTAMTSCYRTKQDFETIEKLLLAEIDRQSAEPLDSARRVFAKQLLATVYLGGISLLRSDADITQRFENLKKAYQYDKTNPYVLLELTRLEADPLPPDASQELVTEEDKRQFADQQRIYEQKKQIALEAKLVYNPADQSDANALVLNELGSQALSTKQYDAAIRYFESAIIKAPESPDILNNLAYTYLVCDNPNPKRALRLIDEALREFKSQTADAGRYLSHFRDTRGLAMMQLNRLDEAAADFEIALAERPDNKKILENLVKCYRANGLDPGGWLDRLKQLEETKTD